MSAGTATVATTPRTAAVRPPERRTVLQLVAGVALYILCQVVVTAAAVGVFLLTGSPAGEEGLSVGEILAQPGPAAPVGFAVGAAVAIGGFVVIVRVASGREVSELGSKDAARDTGVGLLVGAGIVAAAMAVLGAAGVYRVEGVAWGAGVITALMFGVGPAVIEEVFFRGVLLRLLDGWLGSWAALAIVSVIFAVLHGASSPAGPVAAVFVFLSASLLLNAAWFLTRSLWLPIALHAGFNAAQSALFGLNVSGNDAGSSVLVGMLRGPDALTGGVMGGEGSLVVIGLALAAGIAMLVVAVRRGAFLPRVTRRAPAADTPASGS